MVQRADRLFGEQLVALMHGLERVAHAAFAEKLRLAEVGIPARAADPAAHHETPARHKIGVGWRRAGEQRENLVAYGGGAPLVGIEAENPVAAAGFNGVIA